MDRPDILIKVGAGFDRSFDAVLADAQKKWERAFGQGPRAGSGNAGAGAKQMLAVEQQIYNQRSKLNQKIFDAEAKKELELAKLRMRLQNDTSQSRQRDARVQDAHVKAYYRNIVAEHQRAEAAKRAEDRRSESERQRAMKAEQRAQYQRNREIDRLATRTSHRATRFFFPPPEGALGYMKRTAFDMARGAGIDFSMSSGVARARERESAAVALSNQGWIPGQGKFESRISAESLRKTSGDVAAQFKIDETGILGGMSKFTDVTGDLKTAQETIGMIALLSRASGTAIEDAASAAADMSMQLGNIPDKANVLARLMGVAAMGGKQGAVEMKDLAKYVPQIVAYAGTMIGDRAVNMGKLLAITQTARQYGGAGNAAIAATATAGMMNTLQTPARVKEFEGHFAKFTGGHASVYNEKGQLRPIDEILLDSIKAAGTGKYRQVEFKKMWANVKGGKAATGFMTIYDQAEEAAAKEAAATGRKHKVGVAGEAAYRAQFAKFERGMTPEDQAKLAEQATGTKESRAQAFQQKIDKLYEGMADKLIPALEKLAPTAIEATGGLQKLVVWAASNPGAAISAALAASIARAGLESTGRMFLERAISQVEAAGGMRAGVGAVTGAGAVGTLAAALAVGTATFMMTNAVLNAANVSMNEAKQERSKAYNATYEEFTKSYSEAKTPEEREKAIHRANVRIAATHEERGGLFNAVSQDEEMIKTQRAIADWVKTTTTSEKPWAPGDLAPAQGKQGATAQEIGTNVANAMKNTEIKISGWDRFLDAIVNMGTSMGGPVSSPPRSDWSPS